MAPFSSAAAAAEDDTGVRPGATGFTFPRVRRVIEVDVREWLVVAGVTGAAEAVRGRTVEDLSEAARFVVKALALVLPGAVLHVLMGRARSRDAGNVGAGTVSDVISLSLKQWRGEHTRESHGRENI